MANEAEEQYPEEHHQNETEEQHEGNSAAPEFDMLMVPSLPGGRTMYPAEQQGRAVWLIAEGAMTRQCLDEMQEYIRYSIEHHLWIQNWDGKPPPDITGGAFT